MDLKSFDEIIKKIISSEPKRAVVAGGEDEHVLEAVFEAQKNGIVKPVLVGNRGIITESIKILGYEDQPYQIIDNPEGVNPTQTAVDVINAGGGDFPIKGKIQTKYYLGPIVKKENNLNLGGVMSGYTFLQIPNYSKMILVTDPALVVDPDLNMKKGMINNSVNVLKKLGYDRPKVAVLCAVETVNPKMQDTVDAVALVEMCKTGEISGCDIVGPISYDLAISKHSADIKGYECEYSGDFDILLCPNIAAANILVKCLTYTAGPIRLGGGIIGAKVPVAMMSRADEADTKFNSLVLCSALCG